MIWNYTMRMEYFAILSLFCIFCAVECGVIHENGLREHKFCTYENKTYKAGSKFHPDVCTSCHCPHHGGRIRCTVQDCLGQSNCLRFGEKNDECCPPCLELGCLHHDGKVYRPGTIVISTLCEHCFCPEEGGKTVCVAEPCKPVKCVDHVVPTGTCCPVCPNGPNCYLENKIISDHEEVKSGCKLCRCPSGKEPFWAIRSKRYQRRAVCGNIC